MSARTLTGARSRRRWKPASRRPNSSLTWWLSMRGDEKGNGPGGFLLLSDDFEVAGTWAADRAGMSFNYDFWYQPRHNVMVSSEWGAPKTFEAGFNLKDVEAGKYGRRLHFWDW